MIKAQNGRTGIISTWIFVGNIDGIGDESVRRGRASRRYVWECVSIARLTESWLAQLTEDANKAIEIVCVARVMLADTTGTGIC